MLKKNTILTNDEMLDWL